MPRKTMHQPPLTLPPDNPPVRTHIIEQELPQLSIADLLAVGEALAARWQELTQRQQRETMDAHAAHLRALPAGTPLQVLVSAPPDFAAGDHVTLERPLRPPSTNLRVHDRRGKPWHVPMAYLLSDAEGESMRTFLFREAERRGLLALDVSR